jgi:methionyl-tRNA synthetase
VSAVDGFDSYVLWKALQEDRSPREVCLDYHGRIAHDLSALDIDVDDFLDLVQGPEATRHEDNTRRALATLVDAGLVETVTEKVMYSRTSARYLTGAWLTGRCPQCNAGAAGFFCEACGAHFRPEAMVAPQPRMGDTEIEWRDVDSLFLRIPDAASLLRGLVARGIPPHIIGVIKRFTERERGRVRLTAPGDWGVRWDADRFGNPRVVFEAGWEYALTCGDQCVSDPRDVHPMRVDSDTTTLVSFGIDNAVLLLACSAAILGALPGNKPFDHALTNYFYNLQGEKFSTSRQHVIWAADIVEATPAASDAVRYFLARESPEQGASNFDVDEFIGFVNDELVETLQTRLHRAADVLGAMIGESVELDERMRYKLSVALEQLDESFRLDAVSVRTACRVLRTWIVNPELDLTDAMQAYGWLTGFACIAAPVMPRIASEVWNAIGRDGAPSRRALSESSSPRGGLDKRIWFTPLSREALAPCLPPALLPKRSAEHA